MHSARSATNMHNPAKYRYAGASIITRTGSAWGPVRRVPHGDRGLYMVIDERRAIDSFRVPRPDLVGASLARRTPATTSLTTKPNETPQWAADAVKNLVRREDPEQRSRHMGACAFKAGTRRRAGGREAAARDLSRPQLHAADRAGDGDRSAGRAIRRRLAFRLARREAPHQQRPAGPARRRCGCCRPITRSCMWPTLPAC